MPTCNALIRLYFSQWGAGRNQRIESMVGAQSADAFLVAMKHRTLPMLRDQATHAHSVARKIIEEGIHKNFDDLDALRESGLIGTTYQHHRNQKIYVITDFIWDSEIDVWKIAYERWLPEEAECGFIRSFENAFGDILVGSMPVKRFEQMVTGVSSFS